MGFFQGIMLFTGEKALKNANLWGSVFLLSSIGSVSCFLEAKIQKPRSTLRLILGHKGIMFAAFALALLILYPVVSDLIAIDGCLDKGGSFDHVKSACDYKQTHSAMSLFERQGFLLVAALIFGLPVLIAVSKWLRLRN
jgi:hypothetical protein